MSERYRTSDERGFVARRIAQVVGLGAAALIVAATLSAGALSPVAPTATTADGQGNVSVEVTDDATPTATPRPTTSSPGSPAQTPIRPGAGTGGRTTSTATGTATVATISDPLAADDALASADVVDGIVAMSGLTVQAAPSLDVGNGSVTVDFVMRNLSRSAFDSTASFWIVNAFGSRLAVIDDVDVAGLEPDETRRVQVRFEGLGQHVLVHAHATLIPPTTLDGVDLEPMSRDSSALVPPWFSIVLIAVLGALSWVTWRFVLRRRVPGSLMNPAEGSAA